MFSLADAFSAVSYTHLDVYKRQNLGSNVILEGIGPDGKLSEEARGEVNGLLKRQFRPEFLNRLDEIVFYTPLTKAQIEKIADLTLEALNKRLAERGVTVRLTDEAKAYVVENGYDPRCV